MESPPLWPAKCRRTDTLSMSGIPGLGFDAALVNQAMVNNSKQTEDDELMIIITPHVLANFNRNTSGNLACQREVETSFRLSSLGVPA